MLGRTGLCFWLSPANCLLLDTDLEQFYTLTRFNLELWNPKLPNFPKSKFWVFFPQVLIILEFLCYFYQEWKFHLIAKCPSALKHRITELEATEAFLKSITSQLWNHLGSDNLWLSPRFPVCVLWLLEMWRRFWYGTRTKELSILSSSSSLLGWLQIWYLWPELCPPRLEVWSWILPAVSLWAELAGAVPTEDFSSISHVCFRTLLVRLERAWEQKGLGAKGLVGKEIKAGPCCRGGREGWVLEGAEGAPCYCRGWRVVSPPKGANARWFLPSALYIFSLLGKFSSAGYCLSLSPEELMWLNLCPRKGFIMRNGEVLFKSLVFIW